MDLAFKYLMDSLYLKGLGGEWCKVAGMEQVRDMLAFKEAHWSKLNEIDDIFTTCLGFIPQWPIRL